MLWAELRSLFFPVSCLGCGKVDSVLCATCARCSPVQVQIGSLHVGALGEYAGCLREAVLRLKQGDRLAGAALAALLSPHVAGLPSLVPVPTTSRRCRDRGFDQGALLADLAAKPVQTPVAYVLRKQPGAPQHGGSRTARLGARGRYEIRKGVALPRSALLIDDVCTTGATLTDAAAVLQAGGTNVIGAWVIAWTPPAGGR